MKAGTLEGQVALVTGGNSVKPFKLLTPLKTPELNFKNRLFMASETTGDTRKRGCTETVTR
jgi:2,4-dienoyl-CoA reductase-like NADH-dependent reductase (Old Yellow Enzyme family)